MFNTLDCEVPDQHVSTTSRSVPFEVGSGKLTFITSFNGLVCVGIAVGLYVYSDMILWNPCTADYKTMSKANSDKECYEVTGTASGLYYSAFDDDYRLLRVTSHLNVYLYSLKFDSWRKLVSTDDLKQIRTLNSETWGASILQNEKLYLLKKGKRETTRDQLSYSIIRFDTKTETFRELPTPFSRGDTTSCLNPVLLHKDRKFNLCEIYSFLKMDSMEFGAKLWRMDGDEDEEWTKVATYPIPRNFHCFEPVHLMSNGNWATLCRSGCHVFKVDLARDFKKISYRTNNPPKGKYIETLVSPNR